MTRLLAAVLAALIAASVAAPGVSSSAGVYEQVLVQTISVPHYAPTGARVSIIPTGQSSKGLIAASQFYQQVCDTYTFQYGWQTQPLSGADPRAFVYILQPQQPPILTAGPTLSLTEHTFSVIGNGTVWSFDVDGTVYATFDAGCATLPDPYYATDAYEQIDYTANRPIHLRDVWFTRAFAYLVGGSWIDPGPTTGLRGGYTCPPLRGCSFDAHGMLQESGPGLNQIHYSSRFKFGVNSFQLW